MSEEALLYIEDANNRRLYYRFSPATLISNFVPLIVLLHDEAEVERAHFEYKMWNVLTPIDNFGYEQRGSCWLGEKGDFFVKDLLQELIKQIAEEYECEDHIYLYGDSMGAYGAILHGILCKANAVYARSPRIRLEAGRDTEVKRFYEAIFADQSSKEKDLSNFLNSSDTFPLFYLCDDSQRVEENEDTYIAEETAYFVQACKKHDVKYRLGFCVDSHENEEQTIKAVLDMLERVSSQV